MAIPRYPLLYQINTRVWLTDLSRSLAGTPHWMTFPMQSSTASPGWGSTGSGF